MTKLSLVINTKLKKKNNDDVRRLVKGTGIKNNLSFQESGLDKEVMRIKSLKKNYSKPLKKITIDL
jgi:hypothetical protein